MLVIKRACGRRKTVAGGALHVPLFPSIASGTGQLLQMEATAEKRASAEVVCVNHSSLS